MSGLFFQPIYLDLETAYFFIELAALVFMLSLLLRNVHEITSTTITQNYCFRLDDLKRRIVILRNDWRSFSLGQ